MAAGKRRKPLTVRERRAIVRAVDEAEKTTGLEFCVYLGPGVGSQREHAERAFVEAGLHERPAVVIAVSDNHRRVDVITAPSVRERVPDNACENAVLQMTPLFAQGRFLGGLLVGLALLVEAAGPGSPEPGATDLPDLLE